MRPSVGYLSQRFTLYGDLTVEENILFFGEVHRVKEIRPRLERLLAFTHLQPFRQRRADRLSGGMQKKLALACTLVHDPQVLFLDEPTTGVDPTSRREFWRLLSELSGQGLAVLMTTPYLDEAERMSRVALVRAGRTLACDTPARLRAGFGSRIWEVVCDPVRRACELLHDHPHVASVQLYGDRLHVLPRTAGDSPDVLRPVLAGVRLVSLREMEPTLEDVFIRMVEASEVPGEPRVSS